MAISAKVPLDHAHQVVAELDVPGIIQPVGSAIRFKLRRCGGVAQRGIRRVDRGKFHQGKDEEGHADDHDRQSHKPSSYQP